MPQAIERWFATPRTIAFLPARLASMRDLDGGFGVGRYEGVTYCATRPLARPRGYDKMGVTEVVADQPLSGRVALVTGAAQGVGRACAVALARAGCFVAACDDDGGAVEALDETAEICERESGRALAFTADVTDAEAVERLWVEVTAALGAPIVLVNGAGATPPKPLGETSPNEWQADVRAHLDAAFYCARAVLPAMRAAGFGRILN